MKNNDDDAKKITEFLQVCYILFPKYHVYEVIQFRNFA